MQTRWIGSAAAALALLALTPAAAVAHNGGNGADTAAHECQALRAELGAQAFRETVGAFGACVRQRRDAGREAARECRDELEELGPDEFAAEWPADPSAEAAAASAARKGGKGRARGKGKAAKGHGHGRRTRTRGRGRGRGRSLVAADPTDAAFLRCVTATTQEILDDESSVDDELEDGLDSDDDELLGDGDDL